MQNQQLVDYINQCLAAGQTKEQIRQSLLQVGWQEGDINEVLDVVGISERKEDIPPDSIIPLPGVFSLFKSALSLYKQNLKLFIGIMLVPTLIAALIYITNILTYKNIIDLAIVSSVLSVLLYFATGWSLIALVIIVIRKQKINKIKDAYYVAIQKTFSYFWLVFLSYSIIASAGLFLGAGVILSIQFTSEIFTYIGILFFIIPLIILFTWFAFWAFVFIDDGRRGLNALLASKKYVKGRWKNVAWRLLSIFIVYILISFIIGIILGILVALLSSLIGFSNEIRNNIVVFIWQIIGLFATPLFITYLFYIYDNLKRQKEREAAPISRKTKIAFTVLGFVGSPIILILGALQFLNLFSFDDKLVNDQDLRLNKVIISENDNAIYELFKIDNVIKLQGEERILAEHLEGKKWDDDFVNEISAKNATALNYFTEALKKPKYQQPSFADPDKISLASETLSLNSLRKITDLNLLQALKLVKQDKSQEAIDAALQSIKITQKIQEAGNISLIEYLVSVSVEIKGLRTIRDIVGWSQLPSQTLMKYSLDLNSLKNGNIQSFSSAMKGEYLASSHSIDLFSGYKTEKEEIDLGIRRSPIFQNFYFKPNQIKNLNAEYFRQMIEDAEKSCGLIKNDRTTKTISLVGNLPISIPQLIFMENAVGKYLHESMVVGLSSVQNRRCVADLEIGATQIIIALKGYYIDKGVLPDKLEDLVPNYISEIPQDSFSGQLLKYDKENKIIYSVGKDLKDNSGDKDDVKFEIKF